MGAGLAGGVPSCQGPRLSTLSSHPSPTTSLTLASAAPGPSASRNAFTVLPPAQPSSSEKPTGDGPLMLMPASLRASAAASASSVVTSTRNLDKGAGVRGEGHAIAGTVGAQGAV